VQLWDRKMKKMRNKNPEKKIEHFFILHAKNPVFFLLTLKKEKTKQIMKVPSVYLKQPGRKKKVLVLLYRSQPL
jgi:hypothetical protein